MPDRLGKIALVMKAARGPKLQFRVEGLAPVACWKPRVPQARLVPPRLPRRVVAVACSEKAAKHYPANHRRKNEPKLRVHSSIDSHVILHGRP